MGKKTAEEIAAEKKAAKLAAEKKAAQVADLSTFKKRDTTKWTSTTRRPSAPADTSGPSGLNRLGNVTKIKRTRGYKQKPKNTRTA